MGHHIISIGASVPRSPGLVKSSFHECVEKVGLSLCLDWRVYSSWVIIRLNSFRTLIQIGESYLGPQTTV
jgi:hypothetical protein